MHIAHFQQVTCLGMHELQENEIIMIHLIARAVYSPVFTFALAY